MMKQAKITLLVVLITLPTLIPFFNNKFFYTQDHIFIARLQQMSTALADGHFPVRWAADLRYGEPIFNYYAPLPYYLGTLIHVFGFNFIQVAKILFILSTVLSALAMYVLAEKLFGKKAGILAATVYTYAPYRAVDIYVRGALSETWAFVFFPLIFYASILLLEKRSLQRVSLLSVSLAGLFLTHNVTTLMFLPFLGLWWVYLTLKDKNWKLTFFLAGSFTLGLGLAAFFLLPALLENSFIQTKYLTVGYFNFRAHFVAYRQFFSTFWGYGSSLWGLDDGLSFQIGLGHWLILALAFVTGLIYNRNAENPAILWRGMNAAITVFRGMLGGSLKVGFSAALVNFLKKTADSQSAEVYRKNRKLWGLLSFLGLSFFFSIFMQHNKSAFIWEWIPILAFIQFPWRFLTISVFLVAITSGVVADCLRRFKIIYFIFLVLVILINLNYFRPEGYVDDNFFDKFLHPEIMRTGRDLTKDYLPIWVKTTDAAILSYPETEEGRIEVSSFKKKTGFATARVNVLTDSLIVTPIAYFPGWTVSANGKNISLEKPSEQGLISFKLPTGNYNLQFEFKDTPVRMIGNIISAISILLVLIIFRKKFSQKY